MSKAKSNISVHPLIHGRLDRVGKEGMKKKMTYNGGRAQLVTNLTKPLLCSWLNDLTTFQNAVIVLSLA